MVTPLKSQNELDIEGLNRLIDHVINGGIHGLFFLGTTGEAQSLSYDLRYELVEQAIRFVNARKPILIGISDTSFNESIKLAEHSYQCGASAVVATPPYYYTPNQSELINYFKTLADKIPLPLFLYNMPSHVKVHLSVETVQELSRHDNIIGLKDSSGDLLYFQKIVQAVNERNEFSLFIGPEEILMQAVITGGDGGVHGGANMFPKLYVKMYEAAVNHNFTEMSMIQKKILEISSNIYSIGKSGGGYLPGLKTALAVLGICNNVMALPYLAFGENESSAIRNFFEKFNYHEWM